MPYVFKSTAEAEGHRVAVAGVRGEHDFSDGNLETDDPSVAAALEQIPGVELAEESDPASVQDEQKPEAIAERNEKIFAARDKSDRPGDDAYTYAVTGEEAVGADLTNPPSEEHSTVSDPEELSENKPETAEDQGEGPSPDAPPPFERSFPDDGDHV